MGGMGGGMFNVAPEKVGKMKVATVCLDHGKKDPNPRTVYKMIPLESYTNNAEVAEVCRMLGNGKISQNIAQAATWHLANGLSWQELAVKDRVRLSNGYFEKWFSPIELRVAVNVASYAAESAKKQPATPSPGELSQNTR
ncbi:MAG: hypothetical protein KDA59_08795, partial [Planctomycetales bacterium]|nr:hypothetical protein [Planctomycetales bacterium]